MGERPDAMRITGAFRGRRRRARATGRSGDASMGRTADADRVAEAGSAPDVPHVVEDGTLADVPALVAAIERAGHGIRFSDRTGGAEVPPEVARVGYDVVRDSAALLIRRAPCPQNVQLRIRVEPGELVLSMQSTARDDEAPEFVLAAHDLRPLHRRITDAGGRMVVTSTSAGNWLTIGRLPF